MLDKIADKSHQHRHEFIFMLNHGSLKWKHSNTSDLFIKCKVASLYWLSVYIGIIGLRWQCSIYIWSRMSVNKAELLDQSIYAVVVQYTLWAIKNPNLSNFDTKRFQILLKLGNDVAERISNAFVDRMFTTFIICGYYILRNKAQRNYAFSWYTVHLGCSDRNERIAWSISCNKLSMI